MQRLYDLAPEALRANVIHDDIFVDIVSVVGLNRLTIGIARKEIDPLVVGVGDGAADGSAAYVEGIYTAGIVETEAIVDCDSRLIDFR